MTGGKHIDEASIEWGAPGDGDAPSSFAPPFFTPRSDRFDDVYFSGDGPAETRHVFLNGNNLPARFDTVRFYLGELGFGTGLNFLTTWNAWKKARKPEGARLCFCSVEAFPLAADDMARAHQAWPQYDALSARLRERLPPLHPGFHCLNFDDVSLTLFYGDALAGLSQMEGGVDAWYLDGFSPAKNPAMWSPELFAELARLCKPRATFATFTVAGAVRRALEQAGFEWEKRPGFGRKKDMLAGRLGAPDRTPKRAPWFARSRALPSGAQIAVIGAGIAGASLAHALSRSGFSPTVFEMIGAASGASGNPAGLIMPRLDLGDTPAGRFHTNAYLHTIRLLTDLNAQDPVFDVCGVLHHATNAKETDRQQKLLAQGALPGGWMEARAEGLFYAQAGVVDPPAFVRALLGDTPIISGRVNQLRQSDEGGWRIVTEKGEREFDAVIIANGLDALRFSQARTLPLTGSAGQIDWFPEATPPAHAHAFGPYAAPAPKGGAVIGATYAPIAIGAEARFTPEATQSNIAAVARTLPEFAARLDPSTARPRASVRCTTPDRMPVAGPIPDWGYYGGAYDGLRTGRRQDYPAGILRTGLYILSGLGSRGLVTAPYAAQLIAAELTGAPSPADIAMMEALHPARFFIRDLKRARNP